jgi:molybdate transport repressor ModE-like protein
MRLVPAVGWLLDGRTDQALDARALPLLRAIAERGTLTAAARSTGVSYRWAWGLVEDLERRVGSPLVELERGRGARLTSLGVRFLAADENARALLATHERELALPLRGGPLRAAAARRLAIAASHDMALGELRETWRADYAIDIEFHGSAMSLARYVEGAVDIAGFHVAHHRQGGREVLLSLLRPGRDAVIRFLRRTQGLILPHGNPQHVHALRDIATKRLRLVNRQPGSGTRILLDRLLVAEGLTAAGLAGYANEEFTHAAVAATVASGKADAGFGLQAAATAFGLAFVPVAQESYLFACRRRAVDSAPIAAFRGLLAGSETREAVDRLAGYALDDPGAVAEIARRPGGEIELL